MRLGALIVVVAAGIAIGDEVITVVPVVLSDLVLAADLAAGLVQVEEGMHQAARAQSELLGETSTYGIDAGGKRFRATLVLLAAHFGDPRDPRVVPAAVAIELTHLATLFHDDVMDEAEVRRGWESPNARWTNSIAILTGDFLFARASSILADLGAEAVRIQAETFSRLVAGQIAETVGAKPGQDAVEHYMEVVTGKTASLIATAGEFGAMFSGASPELVSAIASAGAALGIAFQLSDDILDITSESLQSGKTPGTDLREGVRSLPVLHALRAAGPEDARLVELLSTDLSDPELLDEALGLLRKHPGMDLARADVRHWANQARELISALPDVPARSALAELCDFTVERTS
jgi:heptaprenyl diphosphate synthase